MAPRIFFFFVFLASWSPFISQVNSMVCTNAVWPNIFHNGFRPLSNYENWKLGVMTPHNHADELDHEHSDDAAWMRLFPEKLLQDNAGVEDVERAKLDWALLYKKMKMPAAAAAAAAAGTMKQNYLKEIDLQDVQVDPDSYYGRAQRTNTEYLLMFEIDRLLWNFRKQAGLPAPGRAYGGWEDPSQELRGHFIGHYLSSTALTYAHTKNTTIYDRMTAVVDALHECQVSMGTGYLAAFPTEYFDRYENLVYVWAPYYTIHKIMNGLVDQYVYAHNEKALNIVKWMVEYFGNRIKNVIEKYSIERHWRAMNEEFGGMNDVLYRLYTITGDPNHLILAHLFDKPCLLGLLAVQANELSGFHVNTHIPIIIGSQRRHEITGEPLYKEMGKYFLDIVNSTHAYATGGTSFDEHWHDPSRLGDTLLDNNEESCTTYNMLKVARNLLRWTKSIAYADYYERAHINGVLSIQRGTEPGVMIYFLPMGRGAQKSKSHWGWGTPFNSMWCCYGTATESFAKLGDTIYFEEEGDTPTLYVVQYIPSTINWRTGGIILNQKTKTLSSSDTHLRILYTVLPQQSSNQTTSTLKIRIPSWSSSIGAIATLNNESLAVPIPGNYLSVTRKWASNDKLVLELPINLRTEPLKDDRPSFSTVQAILFGPHLLSGFSTGDWDLKSGNATALSDYVSPIPDAYRSQLVSLSNGTFFIASNETNLIMEESPEDGTDAAMHATFRIYAPESASSPSSTSSEGWSRENLIGKTIVMEPFANPGVMVKHEDMGVSLTSSSLGDNTMFQVIAGLDGKPDSISLQPKNRAGCFLATSCGGSRKDVVLKCSAGDAAIGSFKLQEGLREYNDITFIAKGKNRSYLLEPLRTFKDETYTVYFNVTS